MSPMASHAAEFVVTGFGTFHGVDANPTTALVEWLANQPHLLQGDRFRVLSVRVLPVAARDVDAFCAQLPALVSVGQTEQIVENAPAAAEQPQPAADGANSSAHHAAASSSGRQQQPCARTGPLVLLHLGVAVEAVEFRLEQRAYNCATFRVPDQRGWQPAGLELEPGAPGGVEHCRTTGLDLQLLQQRLAECEHPVVVSQDAGRFLCNYVYYRSLSGADALRGGGRSGDGHSGSNATSTSGSSGSGGAGAAGGRCVQSLFVHVPPFGAVPEDRQRRFLADLLAAIAQLALVPDAS